MGALSRQDEQALLIGCGAVLFGAAVFLGAIGFSLFKLAEWVFS